MNLIARLDAYIPADDREAQEKEMILSYVKQHPDTVLQRGNLAAHFTSSAFIVNAAGDKMLMVHHTQRGVWAWPGGHADGESDLAFVARKEAEEETGIRNLKLLSEMPASLDVLHVHGHIKKGKWVNTHLHLTTAYIFLADEQAPIWVKEDENTAVAWLPFSFINAEHFDEEDVYLYGKLAKRTKKLLTT
ncbi:MAG: NUDIX domain-containing protein [Clostridiales bacterium]|nr:NUDIX domain-containing protein [Clostridiales bacterium]